MSDISYKQQFSAILVPYYARLQATFSCSVNTYQDGERGLCKIAREWADYMGEKLSEYVGRALKTAVEDGQTTSINGTIQLTIRADWFCLSHCFAKGVAQITDVYEKARVFHEVSNISMSIASELINTENLLSLGRVFLRQGTEEQVSMDAHWEVEDADMIVQRLTDMTIAHPRLLGLLILYNNEEAYSTSCYKALRPQSVASPCSF